MALATTSNRVDFCCAGKRLLDQEMKAELLLGLLVEAQVVGEVSTSFDCRVSAARCFARESLDIR